MRLYLSVSVTSESTPDLFLLPMASGSNRPWATIFRCRLRPPDSASKAWSSAILWSADDLLTLTESGMAAECVKVTSNRDRSTASTKDICTFCIVRDCVCGVCGDAKLFLIYSTENANGIPK